MLHGSLIRNGFARDLMSSESRKVSPVKFRKRLSFNSHNHGKLSGVSTASMASSGLSTASMASSESSMLSQSSSPSCRSSRPARGKAAGSLPGSQMLQMSANSSVGSTSPSTPNSELMDTLTSRSNDSVSVTVRFRPLSSREIQKGDQVAWRAEDDTIVRSNLFVATAFAFDRVFNAATTTRQVYDTAAQHVVQGAMEGVNGTVFAYGVTSSGKTHTMHGDQESPGIIPQAIKNVFSIIQETPGREFLLRVSYLEIYNEVINDLLNPAGQNLRVREDAQGTYVEGLKEEVIVSPAHCLSLIAMGEEHRHVGSNNFNLLSSRSHTMFRLTIESSPREIFFGDEEVSFSRLNLIDLAGSESSKTETTGLRRKEGSFINKSLLTLGTVISKLTDRKATHIPYRDSKLTRLLQSSLSGNGLISMICTITPATSSNEETHNTLKFAHRAKQVEIHALPNKILDEKSLIKKYQKEIQHLKLELQQLKKRMVENSQLKEVNKEDFATLKQQLEAGQLMLQSRLEEEEQTKAALLGRIERLTKLILVSSKNTASQALPERQNHRRRHSLNEEELVLLPDRMHGSNVGGDDLQLSSDRRSGNMIWDCLINGETKTKKKSALARLKHKKNDPSSVTSLDSGNSSNISSFTSGSQVNSGCYLQGRKNCLGQRKRPILTSKSLNSMQAELFSLNSTGRRATLSESTVAEKMNLLREQVKILAGEIAFCITSLKRLSEQAVLNSETTQIQMKALKDELWDKKQRIFSLQWHIVENGEYAPNDAAVLEFAQAAESKRLQNVIAPLHEQVVAGRDKSLLEDVVTINVHANASVDSKGEMKFFLINEGNSENNGIVEGAESKDLILLKQEHPHEASELQLQLSKKMLEIEKLKLESNQLRKERDTFEAQSLKVAEEASYARELACAASVELRNLAQEVTKLSVQNSNLIAELAMAQECAYVRAESQTGVNGVFLALNASGTHEECRTNIRVPEETTFDDMRREMTSSLEGDAALEALIAEKELNEVDICQKMEKGKRKEIDLENDLAGMWKVASRLMKGTHIDELNEMDFQIASELSDNSMNVESTEHEHGQEIERMPAMDVKSLQDCLEEERHHNAELQTLVSQLKIEDLEGLDLVALEDLSALHTEALTRLYHAKARVQEKSKKNENSCGMMEAEFCKDRNALVCKVCFEAAASSVLLPCCHFSVCRSCALACTGCPLCKRPIQERILLNT